MCTYMYVHKYICTYMCVYVNRGLWRKSCSLLKISNKMKKISYEPRRNLLQPKIVKNLLRVWSVKMVVFVRIFYKNNSISFLLFKLMVQYFSTFLNHFFLSLLNDLYVFFFHIQFFYMDFLFWVFPLFMMFCI